MPNSLENYHSWKSKIYDNADEILFDEIVKCIDAQAYKQFGNAVNVELVKLFAKYMFGDAGTLKKYSAENARHINMIM